MISDLVPLYKFQYIFYEHQMFTHPYQFPLKNVNLSFDQVYDSHK